MKYVLIYTLFLMSAFHTSCGQKQAAPHKDNINYNIKDTVTSYGPNTMVRNIKKGSNGSIVFAASWGGVFRYDGKLFTNLASKIGSRRFWDILEDRRGNLWFASTDSGVYHYNGKTFRHFTTREGLADNLVMRVYEDRAGIIWLAAGGLTRYDGKSFQNFTTKDGLPGNSVRDIMEDKTGRLWIGTASGPCFYDGKTFTVLKNKDGKLFNNVWSIIEDKKGSIWFGDTDGLWRYDGSTFTRVSQMGAFAIIEDKEGNIWTTGQVHPGGVVAWKLLRYDQKTLYDKNPIVTEIMSTQKMLCGILEADDGSIWFGSINGVYRYDGKTITALKRKEDQKI